MDHVAKGFVALSSLLSPPLFSLYFSPLSSSDLSFLQYLCASLGCRPHVYRYTHFLITASTSHVLATGGAGNQVKLQQLQALLQLQRAHAHGWISRFSCAFSRAHVLVYACMCMCNTSLMTRVASYLARLLRLADAGCTLGDASLLCCLFCDLDGADAAAASCGDFLVDAAFAGVASCFVCTPFAAAFFFCFLSFLVAGCFSSSSCSSSPQLEVNAASLDTFHPASSSSAASSSEAEASPERLTERHDGVTHDKLT